MTPGAVGGGVAYPSPIRRILLATDLSHVSDVATDLAFDLAHRVGASLLVVSVIDPRELRLPGGRFLARVDQVRERREATARELVQRGRRGGVAVTFMVWVGDPAESIVAAAASEGADLVLVGSHGRGALGRIFLGSVSDQVVRNAPCPVLVARTAPPPASSSGGTERQAAAIVDSAHQDVPDGAGPRAAALGDTG
ncbi:MAG TPA: universal stress protein [Candidatus Limnocylindrales bacterium]|nr:universal stress protein [Candidatus Limnocylindrales bacterium]